MYREKGEKMPTVNYCKKCQAEVPRGETCVYCGGKLTKTGEQISFGAIYKPVREWTSWKPYLRTVLFVWLLIAGGSLAAEAYSSGKNGVAALLAQNYLIWMVVLLFALLGLVFALLYFQQSERVHYVLDKDGVHARTYLEAGNNRQLALRFRSSFSCEKLQQTDTRPALDGLVQISRVTIPWSAVRRVCFCGDTIQFFRPRFWQALAVHCPREEAEAAEEYIRKKMHRFKTVPVLPPEQNKKKR